WNRQGKLLQTLTGHENEVNGVAFSPDGETIATASRDKTVKLWNRQGKLLQTLTGHENEVWGVAFSPDGETIATASRDKTVKLWNRQGKLLQTLTGHENEVNGVAFSPDGETIATASRDKTVKLWNVWKFDRLHEWGCNWMRDYLENNPNVSESDRHLCDGVISCPVEQL
ncbi:WD40 repeat domain-containing protein, partial [Okeania hirsuta]